MCEYMQNWSIEQNVPYVVPLMEGRTYTVLLLQYAHDFLQDMHCKTSWLFRRLCLQ